MSERKRTTGEEDALAEARRRDAINRERFALRRQLRAMSAEEHALERTVAAMVDREKGTEAENRAELARPALGQGTRARVGVARFVT